ncbi:MAG: 50S ribosomal protein L24 [Patescibacteria group bacterium]
MTQLRIKTGDEVIVIAGADKGKKGKVIQTFPKLNRVVVEGVNLRKRHMRAAKSNAQGQTVEFSMPMNASNVALVVGGKPARHNKRAA